NRMIKPFDSLKGAAFDHRFLSAMASGHEKAIAAFKRESEHGENADVKAFAASALPTLEDHLHKAQDLLKPAKRGT
ncbi:MAG: DUF4142 domain-containing protein, partial [Pseudomonadota bacterium]